MDSTYSNMVFERSSGYAGYRCIICGKWEYLEDAKNHKCSAKTKPIYTPDQMLNMAENCIKALRETIERSNVSQKIKDKIKANISCL